MLYLQFRGWASWDTCSEFWVWKEEDADVDTGTDGRFTGIKIWFLHIRCYKMQCNNDEDLCPWFFCFSVSKRSNLNSRKRTRMGNRSRTNWGQNPVDFDVVRNANNIWIHYVRHFRLQLAEIEEELITERRKSKELSVNITEMVIEAPTII